MSWLAIGTGLATLLLLAAESRRSRAGILVCKPLAATGFVATAVAAGALETPYGLVVLAALVWCWLGDVLLLFCFLPGLAAFTIGHLVYAVAWILRGTSPTACLAALTVLALPATAALAWLLPKLPAKLRPAVVAYAVLFTAGVALAIGTGSRLAAAGALCFYVSDLAVARNRFVTEQLANKLWGVPLYFGGQLMIALSLAA